MTRREAYRKITLLSWVAGGVIIIFTLPFLEKFWPDFPYMAIAERILFYLFVAWIGILFLALAALILILPRWFFRKGKLRRSIQRNLEKAGIFEADGIYKKFPRIHITPERIYIKQLTLYDKKKIDSHRDNMNTALPKGFVVSDSYFSNDGNSFVLEYENLKERKPERYNIKEYRERLRILADKGEIYFDKKHIHRLGHMLICGQSGSGKSVLVREIVLNALYHNWETYIYDVKGSYAMFEPRIEQKVSPEEILSSLLSIEEEMENRYIALKEAFKDNADLTAADIGFKPVFVIIEEMISLSKLFDKEQKKEFDRALMNLLVKARQASIFICSVMQNPSSSLIDTTTRGQFSIKVLLLNNQNNIQETVFGDIELPQEQCYLPGEGIIEVEGKVSVLRTPWLTDFNKENL